MSELNVLKARAKVMGIDFHPSIGEKKLQAKIAEKLSDSPKEVEPVKVSNATEFVPETQHERNKRIRDKANTLVRIQVTNMNPRMGELEGQYYSAGNTLVGQITKYVQFNVPWHVPFMVLEAMKERKCQVFYNERKKNGDTVRKGKLIPELSIQELPYLSPREMKDLAQRQAMANGTSE